MWLSGQLSAQPRVLRGDPSQNRRSRALFALWPMQATEEHAGRCEGRGAVIALTENTVEPWTVGRSVSSGLGRYACDCGSTATLPHLLRQRDDARWAAYKCHLVSACRLAVLNSI